MSLVMVFLQGWFGMATAAAAIPTLNSPRQGTRAASSVDAALDYTQMRLSALKVKWQIFSMAVVSELNPPSELTRLSAQFEEPLIRTALTTLSEDNDLLRALRSYQARTSEDDFSALNVFVSDHPHSGWRIALLTNLGLAYYHNGYFSKAIASWEQAWHEGQSVTDAAPKALVDRAIGELIRMHARIGHADELATLLKEVEAHPVSGPATEAVDGAKQGLWMMRNEPGVAYLCGPMALKSLLVSESAPTNTFQFLEKVRSSPNGFTLAQVAKLADQAKLGYQLVFRKQNQPIPVPSVVHWSVNHFAAIVGETNGRFHIQDPTFGSDLWVSRSAIDSEASGYFLVPGRKATSWRSVSLKEAGEIHGMGYTGSNQPGATSSSDDDTGSDSPSGDTSNGDRSGDDESTGDNDGGCGGMCGYSVTEMLVSLKLHDSPVGYRPAVGPAMFTSLTYNQREASQPATFGWYNVGPKWTLNWLTYIQDNPTSAGNNVSRYIGGGGSLDYTGFSSSTGAFTPETRNASVLVRTSASPIVYQRQRADGGVEIFSQSNGATSFPRRIFLTKVIDPAGNILTFNYDSQFRLISITDATNRSTAFSYGLTAKPLLVTAITDPFGRSAQLAYDSNGRLSQITDVLGLTSQFTYDASGLINALTTPYGKTTFAYGDNGNTRFVNATDPLGKTERVEYTQGVAAIPFSDPANLVPQGIQVPFNQYLNGRNTYIWDKHAHAVAAGDYTKARIKHWTHLTTNTNITANTVESVKNPLENRIWYNYPGQVGNSSGLGTAVSGTLDKRINIARVLDDGTTQLTQYAYNNAGKVTSIIDPLGRQTTFQYAANLIDLVLVQQKISPGFATVAQFTYNNQHEPLTYTDAAGQTTHYFYNGAGQIVQTTDPLGHTSQYSYDGLGRLVQVLNTNNQTAASFTYDGFDRVATRTDSEGYTVSFAYDVFDRLSKETFPDGTTRLYAYNKLDLNSVTDRQGRSTSYAYDAVRRVIDVLDPLSRHTKFGYYENGKLKTLTDPNNNATNWNIDIQSRVTSKVYADSKTFSNTYENTTSRLKSVTDPLAQVKRYTYAKDDDLTGVSYTNAVHATPSVTFAYDSLFQRMASMTDGTGTRQYQYNATGVLGALKRHRESGPYQNDAIAYQYDALGRVVQQTVDTAPETFTYDALGRVSNHTDSLGTFDLSFLGQTAQITSRILHGSTLGTNWSYDSNTNDRRLTDITNSGATRSYHYTTTPENIISQISESASSGSAFAPQTWSYNHDSSDRLLNASASGGAQFNYGYDAADNITSVQSPAGSQSGSYNAVNQITNFGGQSFVYDANGNVTDDGTRTYTWDAENRLLSVANKSQSGRATTFRYDGVGRRIAIIAINGAISTETRYLWCGRQLCQSRNASDTVIRRYYSEGEAIPGSGTLLYYAKDHLGSVRDVLAVQNGSRVASYDYEPYGNPAQINGRVSTDLRYAGMFYEQNSGLYLTEYRAYEPKTGRWLSRDPIGESGGQNLYSYVQASPLNAIDSLGLCIDWRAVGIAVGIGLGIVALTVLTDGLDLPFLAQAGLLGEEGAEGAALIEGESDFFAGTRYSDKVLSQIEQGDYHAFPESVTGFQDAGEVSEITGGDGVTREILRIPGGYKDEEGFFEFIKEADGTINHRLFVPTR